MELVKYGRRVNQSNYIPTQSIPHELEQSKVIYITTYLSTLVSTWHESVSEPFYVERRLTPCYQAQAQCAWLPPTPGRPNCFSLGTFSVWF